MNEDTIKRVDELLLGRGGESELGDHALQHIVTKLTDEGLVIEVFDLENRPLFADGTNEPEPVLIEISAMLVDVFRIVSNGIAINGHVSAQPVVLTKNINWDLSAARADAMRIALEKQGATQERMQRVSGFSDRKPAIENTMAARNSRLEVILLRTQINQN
jgi:chemotaxis protein MotB